MDNSEVDLFSMMKIVWEKKMQILFYSVLIATFSALFAYIQPKDYETHRTAFISPTIKNKSGSDYQIWPQKFYSDFSMSPEILNAILKNLPKELEFANNNASLKKLSSILRVENMVVKQVAGLNPNALQFKFFVRHPDPSSANQIVDIWQEILEDKFSNFEKNVDIKKYNERKLNEKNKLQEMEVQVKQSKKKWDEAKKKSVEFEKEFNVSHVNRELGSTNRIVSRVYSDFDKLVLKMEASSILVAKSEEAEYFKEEIVIIDDEYLVAKETLNENKRLLNLQPQRLEISGNHKSTASGFKDAKTNEVINPVYTKLQQEIIKGEVDLKMLDVQRNSLEQKILKLESGFQSKRDLGESPEFAQRKYQLKILADTIKRYEGKSQKLEYQIREFQLERIKFDAEQEVSAEQFSRNSEKLEQLKSFQYLKPKVPIFVPTTLKSPVFLGSPLKRIIFLAFGVGLVFMVLLTLVKASFISQKEN
jgi:hypothetical protein